MPRTTRTTRTTWIIAIGPVVLIAVIGLFHPAHLTFDAALLWRNAHIVLVPIFPLTALAPWMIARRIDRPTAVVVGVLAFVYATFYTSLDILSGIGAGALKHARHTDGLGTIFGIGGDLGTVGSVALLAAAAVTAGAVARSAGVVAALPGAVLTLLGAWIFMDSHIYRWWGVIGQVLLAAGWAAHLAVVSRRTAEREVTPAAGV